MSLKAYFYQLLGIGPKRPGPIVRDGGLASPADRVELAARTEAALQRPAPPFEPTKPLFGVTTDDVDPATGRLYPNYLERRLQRESERRAGQAEPCELAVINWDVSPKP